MSFKRRVYFRVFPTEKLNFDLIKIDTALKKVYVRHMQDLGTKAFAKEASYWEFDTNGVFFNATQEKVYKEIKEDLLNNVIKGYSGVIIAFGQTGSGKTFTTSGLHFSAEEFGIAPRLIKDVLALKRAQPCNIKMCIQISYVEFNNNSAVDLLSEPPHSMDIYKCRDAQKVKVSNELDALTCLFKGEGRKNYIRTNSEYYSNLRSTVITFHITAKNMELSNPTKICSRIHVVDLAGNDSCANMSALNKGVKEVGLANVTKTQLEQFILRLAENIPKNIKIQQRMNILIYYLDGDFSCENILRFIGHIKVRSEDMLVTLSMLRFAHVVQGLKMKKKHIKFDVNEEVELEYLRKKLENYDKEKHLNSVLLNIDLVSGLNPPRIEHLNNLIQNYIANDIGEIAVMNVADTKLILKSMKEMYTNCQNEVKKLQSDKQVLSAHNKSETSLKHRSSKTSSLGSGTRISKKTSKNIRSKESLVKEKRTSVSSTMSDKKLVAGDDQGVSTDLPKRKKTKNSLTAVVKSASQSRKKTSTTSVTKQDSRISVKSITDPCLPIPDMVPEKKDVWKHYSSQAIYKDKIDEYKLNEKEVKDSFVEYVKELKKLQVCKEAIHKCSNDLIAAQTFRRFNNTKDEYDEDGFLIISFAERECKAHMEEARHAHLIQQERVLKIQEEFKVFLENRRNIIRKIDDQFAQFSQDNYKIPSATSQDIEVELREITVEVDLCHPGDSLEDVEEIIKIPQIPDQTLMIRKLQRLMLQEIETRKRIDIEKKQKFKLF